MCIEIEMVVDHLDSVRPFAEVANTHRRVLGSHFGLDFGSVVAERDRT